MNETITRLEAKLSEVREEIVAVCQHLERMTTRGQGYKDRMNCLEELLAKHRSLNTDLDAAEDEADMVYLD